MRRSGRRRAGISRFKAGLIGIALLLIFSYLAYTKFANPLASKFTVHATFSSANGLASDSLVRIAGVNVGRVSSVTPVAGCKQAGTSATGCQAADVALEIQGSALPLHQDATFAIRPRIFLEGNFFVDLRPGTPSAPIAPEGYTFPIQQGTEPVQFDQVLGALPHDTRHNLQLLLEQYGTAVKEGGPSFNRSIQFWLPAYEYSAIVAHDALGIQQHDLSKFIDQSGTVAGALDAHPQQLQSLITDFNTTANAFARQSVALQQAVGELPRTLATAIPAFNSLNAAFPPLRQLARALLPATVSTGPTIDVSLPFITQLRYLVQPSELRGLTADLAGTVPSLAKLTSATIPLMLNGVRPASSCITNVIYPWSQLTLQDPNFNAKNGFPPHKVYVEQADFLPGLNGETRTFDANGPIIRVGLQGGPLTYSLSPHAFGQALTPLTGAQPTLPPGGKRPPLMPTVPCETQPPIRTLSAPQIPLSPVGDGNGLLPGVAARLGAAALTSHDRSAGAGQAAASPAAQPKATAQPLTSPGTGNGR